MKFSTYLRNRFTKAIVFLLVVTLLMPSFTVFANNGASGDVTLEEYLVSALHTASVLSEFQEKTGINLTEIEEMFAGIQVSDEWITEALAFMDDFANEFGSPVAPLGGIGVVSGGVLAMGFAAAYSFDAAGDNVRRNGNLDFAEEAQFMFISHFVDRPDPFWITGNYNSLRDVETMRRAWAHRITNQDRLTYRNYISVSGFATAFQGMANVAASFYSIKGTGGNFAGAVAAHSSIVGVAGGTLTSVYLGTVLTSMTDNFGYFMSIMQSGLSAEHSVNAILTSLGLATKSLDLDEQYRRFLRNALFSIGAAVLTKGTFGLGGLAMSLAMLQFNASMGLFQVAAWSAMRVSFGMRHSQRVWENMFSFGAFYYEECYSTYYVTSYYYEKKYFNANFVCLH